MLPEASMHSAPRESEWWSASEVFPALLRWLAIPVVLARLTSLFLWWLIKELPTSPRAPAQPGSFGLICLNLTAVHQTHVLHSIPVFYNGLLTFLKFASEMHSLRFSHFQWMLIDSSPGFVYFIWQPYFFWSSQYAVAGYRYTTFLRALSCFWSYC